MSPFQKQPFADVLQISGLKSYAIFAGKQKCFLWILCNFYEQLLFIEHLQWVPLPFTSTFGSYYCEDLLVILFTLTHPSQRLTTGLKLVTEKNSSRCQICLKLTIKISKKEIVRIKTSQ